MTMFDTSPATTRDRLYAMAESWLKPSRATSLSSSLSSWTPSSRSSFWPFSGRDRRADAWVASLGEGIGNMANGWGRSGRAGSGWMSGDWLPSSRRSAVSMDDVTQFLASMTPRRRRAPALGALALLAGVGIVALLMSRR